MGEGVAVESEHGFSSLAFDLETLSLDVAHFQVNLSVLEAQRGNVAIAVDWYVAGMGRHEWIDGYSVERAIDLRRDVPQNNKVRHLALNTTWQVRPVEVFGIGPFGLEAHTILLFWCGFVLRSDTAW